MIDPRTAEYYQHNAVQYAAATASRGMTTAIEPFSAGLMPGATVIDVGCGGGRDLLEFRNRQLNAVGIDVSSHLATIAADISRCPVVVADMIDMPFVSGSFDAAWASASLLHFEADEVKLALAEIRRVLRTGGPFFSSVKEGIGTARDETGRQFTYFETEQWLSLIRGAGFVEVEVLHDEGSSGAEGRWIRVLAQCG